MPKPVRISALALVLGAAMMLLAPAPRAIAQSAGFVNAVDLDIVPAEMEKFMVAIKENGAAAVTEPGCREFNIQVLASNPNHVFLYEVYDNAAALEAHRATDHFKKYSATVANMVSKREVRPMNAIAFNSKSR
ncbi:MAG: (4S)-4-hydroxy-5-phosphonooxypentane-2,3-dione isomerase [Alphaproteobacteria bacterium]|jgi:autoinducer 2-degrading protein|nr:(4S)-4-hydroxy-5-phosphonooxypentane-2,3-dione isomerase [Alphaproteobacteria bacterium]